MSFVIAVIAPVFVIITLGLVAGKTRYLSEGADKMIVELVFRVAIPALLFRMLATASPSTGSVLQLWGAFFAPLAVVWIASTLISLLILRRPPPDAAAIALGSVFGNLVLLGLPIVLKAVGPEAAAPMALIFLIEFPVLWLAATLHHQLAGPMRSSSLSDQLRSLANDLGRNPIILALVAGAIWRATGQPLPGVADQVLETLGRAATPGALFALGLTLARFQIKGEIGTVSAIVLLKIVATPLIAWLFVFHVFTLPPAWAAVIVLFASMPTGAVAFLFATRHDRAVGSISAAIAVGVALSVVTISTVLILLADKLQIAGTAP